MSKPTFNPTDEMKSAANAVFMAMAFVQTIRPIVKKHQQSVLDKNWYKCGNEYAMKCIEHGEEMPEFCKTDHDLMYISDADFGHYHAECYQLNNAAGLTVEDPEHCPLLVAENLERQARDLLAKEMEPITKMTKDMIFQSPNALENWGKYIDLTLRLLAPFATNKLKTA